MDKKLYEIAEIFLSLLSGAIVGYWFAVTRDWRREFNELADPMSDIFAKAISLDCPIGIGPSDSEIRQIIRRMGWWRRCGFRKAIDAYKRAQQNAPHHQGAAGSLICDDPSEIHKEARNVLKHLGRK